MNKADVLLAKVLQGLKAMCNHCQIKDCDCCWSHCICEEINKYFETIPPPKQNFQKSKRLPAPNTKNTH